MSRKTVLSESHVQLGARMVDFSGWDMPLQYDGILAEHHRTRTDVSMFDTCHMGRFLVTGPGTRAALDQLLAVDLEAMTDGQCKYGFLLREDGGILDDVIVYRFSAGRWMIVVNAGTQAGDRDWIRARLPATVTFTDVSRSLAKIDVQGPHALACVARVCGIEVDSLRYFRFRTFDYGGEAIVSRTGYTGEKGVELYVESGRMVELWNRFLADGVKPAGLGARDTLRLEMCYPLYGQDLTSETTPIEADKEKFVYFNKDFIGKDALIKSNKPYRKLINFTAASRRAPRHNYRIFMNGEDIGIVTSGSFSPSLSCGIGMGYVNTPCSAGAEVMLKDNNVEISALVTKGPFYKKGTAKILEDSHAHTR